VSQGLSEVEVLTVEGPGATSEEPDGTQDIIEESQRDGVDRSKSSRDGSWHELGPSIDLEPEIFDTGRSAAVEAVQAWALVTLELKQLQIASALRGRCHHVEHPIPVGQE
jgi:hypothetical protein